ncbi:MAG TPA: SET domain-containing protein [Pirellulales bacterium]|nr:SET domain-containing protein [Pirellulales bacterium]
MIANRQQNAGTATRRRRDAKAPRIARTPVGKGVFAGRRYQAAEIVGEIEGTVIDDADYGSNYCMDLGDDRCLEPAPPFRFMNHSCRPNCWLQWFDITAAPGIAAGRRMFVLALDQIEQGEQLTIDYAWPAHMAIPCRCHTPGCRGWIVAEEELAQMPNSAAL